MNHIPWPKTASLKNIRKEVEKLLKPKFSHLDEAGNPVFGEPRLKNSTITFTGTVKVHGANASIVVDANGEIYLQSRNNAFALDGELDLNGLKAFVNANKERIIKMLNEHKPNLQPNQFYVVFGEWAGPRIQKGVGVSKLDTKKFFIFNTMLFTKGAEIEDDTKQYIVNPDIAANDIGIHNIYEFGTKEVVIDFEDQSSISNAAKAMTEFTEQVEQECPVAKAFGISGTGEGLVWLSTPLILDVNSKPIAFKTKGLKHKETKGKVVEVDEAKMAKASDFVEYACTENRLTHCIEEVLEGSLDIKLTGKVIGWVTNDIIKEEKGALEANGLSEKLARKHLAPKIREMYIARINAQ